MLMRYIPSRVQCLVIYKQGYVLVHIQVIMPIILSEINHVDIEVINISFGSKAVHLHVQPYYFTWYHLLCTLVFFLNKRQELCRSIITYHFHISFMLNLKLLKYQPMNHGSLNLFLTVDALQVTRWQETMFGLLNVKHMIGQQYWNSKLYQAEKPSQCFML